VLEPDVPEYLVDNGLIGDERDDPHCPAAAGTKERILLPDLPDECSTSYAPALLPSPFVAGEAIGLPARLRLLAPD